MEAARELLKEHRKAVMEHHEEVKITNNGGPIQNQAYFPPAGTEHGL